MTTTPFELRNPDLFVRFPRIDSDADEVRCTFDVVPTGASPLCEGTIELCYELLKRVGVTGGELREWSFERICTPFFTDWPSATDWRYRFRISWLVSLTVVGSDPVRVPELGPVAIEIPSRARGAELHGRPGVELCDILAVAVGDTGSNAVTTLGPRLRDRFGDYATSVRTLDHRDYTVAVGRIRVGRLSVKHKVSQLDAIKESCVAMGLATSIPEYELLRARSYIAPRWVPPKCDPDPQVRAATNPILQNRLSSSGVHMTDQTLAVYYIGYPAEGDNVAWMTERLAHAGIEAGEAALKDDRTDADGMWTATVPCHVRHYDDVAGGPLVFTYDPTDFAAAMALPPAQDDELTPVLESFVTVCRALRPSFALLTAQSFTDDEVDRYVVELAADRSEGPAPAVFERSFTALFLSAFDLVMLGELPPQLVSVVRVDLGGGAVFLAPGLPAPGGSRT